MAEAIDVVIIGAGQAGLSLSYELSHAGVDHVILERGRVAETWRGRWDSFCIVIPNWTLKLPGNPYSGSDPDGFMPRDAIVAHLADYAQSFRAPVREQINVLSLEQGDAGDFILRTSGGVIRTRKVVLATGAYQKPHRPAAATQLPPDLHIIDAENYANEQALPPGPVLVVGSGQTGCQLAEEIVEAGRDTYLACGRAPWCHRQFDGRDWVAWAVQTPFLDATMADLPAPEARVYGNVQASGGRGGHDLHYRTLQKLGVTLLGRLVGCEDGVARFAADLADSVAFGDARYTELCDLIRKSCAAGGTAPPEMPVPMSFCAEPIEKLELRGFGAIVFTCGFRPDYTSWVKLPDAFDDLGFPLQKDGSSTIVPGLHFMGVHFQRKRKSATFLGVAEDAAVLAERITTFK
jgi:putative flavoprotein involved in K+ transport